MRVRSDGVKEVGMGDVVGDRGEESDGSLKGDPILRFLKKNLRKIYYIQDPN